MSKHLPPFDSLCCTLHRHGVQPVHHGKVRDTFALPGYPDYLLQLTSNRVSIFDFVLPAEVPRKGEVLTAMTVFWLTGLFRERWHHLIAYGGTVEADPHNPSARKVGVDAHLPKLLRSERELHKRALVIHRCDMLPVECVVRGYLTGSGWKEYQARGTLAGKRLPSGLHDGSRLPEPVFTPTTKAATGHDEPMEAVAVKKTYGRWVSELAIELYREAHEYALKQGIIIADTKFEFGMNHYLCDEVLTPDSSRFWDAREWEHAVRHRKSPTPYDKQVVRDWGKDVVTPKGKGIHLLDPGSSTDLAFVQSLTVPDEILEETSFRYLSIFKRLTGMSLDEFQSDFMGIRTIH